MGVVPEAPTDEQAGTGETPLQLEQVEIAAPLAPIARRQRPDGRDYAAARILVRLHSYPLGLVDLRFGPAGLEVSELAERIGARLGPEIRGHLASDGIDYLPGFGPALAVPKPACQAERRAILDDPPPISVVLATRGRPESLSRCIDALLAVEYPKHSYEIVVVDNGPSEPATRELIHERFAETDLVKYVACARPGASIARNVGAGRAEGELVAMTDDDVIVDRHWLTELVRGFRAAPGIDCVTGLVLPAALDTRAQLLFQQYGGFAKGFERRVYDLAANRPDHPLFPYNAGAFGSGNSVAFRREALIAVGGYDADLGPGTPARGGEDLELFLRLARAGHGIAYEPGAIAFHRDRAGIEELRTQLHDYGVSLVVAMASTVAHDPRALLEIAIRAPYALWFLLSPGSPKNRDQTTSYPAELRRAELAGIARGPVAYLRSRRARTR